MDYNKLVKALRCCAEGCHPESCKYSGAGCVGLINDAADAIEELQSEQQKTVTQIFCEEGLKWEERCKALMVQIKELKSQIPKCGEWILHDSFGYCECPFCRKEWWYTNNDTEDFDFCPACGADLRGTFYLPSQRPEVWKRAHENMRGIVKAAQEKAKAKLEGHHD